MPVDNTPQGIVADKTPVAPSPQDADSLLDSFFDDPEGDTEEEAEPDAEGENPDEQDADEGDPDDTAEDDDADDEDGERLRDDKGRFLADDAKVRLDDGSVTTLKDLKAGSLRQADYTRKTQELAEQRRSVEEGTQRISQLENQLAEERNWTYQVLNYLTPKPPTIDLIEQDPIGYQKAHAQWQEYQTYLGSLTQQQREAEERRQAALAQETQQRVQTERQRLLEVIPDLADERKFKAFRDDALKLGTEVYGFKPDELGSITDSRVLHALSDAIQWRKFKAQKAKATEKTVGKPPVSPGRRQDPKASQDRERQKAMEQLRATGGKGRAGEAATDKLLDKFL